MRIILHFLKKNYYILLFLVLEGSALYILGEYNHFQSSRIYAWSTHIQGITSYWSQEYRDVWQVYYQSQSLAVENAELRSQIRQSKLNLSHEEIIQRDSQYAQMYTYIPAQVISNSLSKRHNYIVLDIGSQKGVKIGMGVISPKGVVGFVSRVSEHFCTVMSVLHIDSKVSAKIEEGGFTGSIVWDGLHPLYGKMTDVPANFKIEKGQEIVSSGYSLSIPPGIPLGTIEEIGDNKGDDFHRLKIRFSTDFYALKEVFVVKNMFAEEIVELAEPEAEKE